MGENKLLWIKNKEDDLGHIYNSEDLYPIAIWLGEFKQDGLDDDARIHVYLEDARDVYELAHRQPEWLKDAEISPWHIETMRYASDYWFNELEDDEDE